jgi:DNA topoisomerase-1
MFLTCAKYPDCKFAQSVSIPSPSDSTSNVPKELSIGQDANGNLILFGINMYGKYLKIESESGALVKRVNLPKEYNEENLELELAIKLASLPKVICVNPDNNEEISLNISKFGPYLKCQDKTANVNKVEQYLEIDADLAIEIIRKAKDKPTNKTFKRTTKVSSITKKRKYPLKTKVT